MTCTLGLPPRGFTLWELLAALALAATLATLAVPGFARLSADIGASAAAEQLVASLQLARATALARAAPASLCASSDGVACADPGGIPATGWLVFLGTDAVSSAVSRPAGALLRSVRLPGELRVLSTRPAIAYWPDARAGTTGTLVVCRAGMADSARTVVVSQTGRPRLGPAGPGQGAACAG
jgi:type IV fimbrial biogenesis protein FimT